MKRMLCAAALAVMLHVMIFRMQMPWAKPAVQMQRSSAVAINLVSAPRPRVQPVALPESRKIQPLRRLPEKKKETRVTIPKHRTLSDEDFEPVPSPDEEAPPDNEDKGEDIDMPQDDDPSQGSEAEEPPRQTGKLSNRKATPDGADESAAVEISFPLRDLNPPVSYPLSAVRRGYTGVVMLKVLVGRQGLPLRIELETSSGYGILDRDALEEVRHWRFKPALRGGVPVKMWIRQPVAYQLQ